MHDSVKAAWIDFNHDLEGIVPRLYADVLGLVTCGMGNLVDPIGLALGLPWELPGGSRATQADIAAAWNEVKNDPLCAARGWKYAIGLPANRVRLSPEAIDDLILARLEDNDRQMLARFQDWEARPADAQMAVHSMAWAMGPAFWRKFPKFTVAFAGSDYASAAAQCAISPAAGTVVERNARNKRLLLAASIPTSDPSILSWRSDSAPRSANRTQS